MSTIAVSGHRGLTAHTTRLIDQAIRAALADQPDGITGFSCLADGVDQIFARAVLDHGGTIEAVIPAGQYRDGLPAEALAEYDGLLKLAAAVHRLPYEESTSEAHMAASVLMMEKVDELWAVWDGKPARGYGGTADVVTYAREHEIPVRVMWPDGATRD